MATKKHTAKHASKHTTKHTAKHSTKSTHTEAASQHKVMAHCMTCRKMMPMVSYKEVDMKMKGGKTRKRYAGVDEHGHKMSAFPKKQ